jgi:hypothetical protein
MPNLNLGQVEMNNSAPFITVYRVNRVIRNSALALLATGLMISAGIWGRVRLGLDPPTTETALTLSLILLGTVLFALHAFTSSLRFTPDALEKRYLLTIVSIPFSEIRGRRQLIPGGEESNFRFYVIVPTHRSDPTIKFGEYHDFDDAFYDWFLSLPDLDAKTK